MFFAIGMEEINPVLLSLSRFGSEAVHIDLVPDLVDETSIAQNSFVQ